MSTKNTKVSESTKKEYWQGWRSFFGHEEGWSESRIKKWLVEFGNNISWYYTWDDAMLQNTFTELNVPKSRRDFHTFFKLFIEERKTPAGMHKIMEALNKIVNGDFDLTTAFAAINKIKKQQNIKKQKAITIKEILYHARNTTIFDCNSKLFDDHVKFTVSKLWHVLFNTGKYSLVRKKKNESKFSLSVIDEWKKQKLELGKTEFENDYCQKKKPDGTKSKLTLHQTYIGRKVNDIGYWFDMSETGAGKTDAALAVIAMKKSEIKNTLIVCPNALIKNGQWAKFIKEAFPKSKVFTKGEILDYKTTKKKQRDFFIISYNTLSSPLAIPLLKKLSKTRLDYIVMDEVQNIKIRDSITISKRRHNIESFVKGIRSRNKKLKVLLLSATPVVNNLREAHSLLTIMTGKSYKNVKTHSTFQNASALHTEFVLNSTRHVKDKKPYKINENVVDVHCNLNVDKSYLIMNDKPMLTWLDLERISIEKKIDDIEKIIRSNGGKYIIFTEYVTGIVDFLEDELSKRFSSDKVTLFTGSDKSGILENKFFKKADIMICSTPIAEGLDSLQKVCNNIIFAGYPWTAAKRDQIVGRVARQGQKKNVNVWNIITSLSGVNFDQEVKIYRMNYKRTFANCVVNGELPKIISMPKRNAKRKEILQKMKDYEPDRRFDVLVPNMTPTEIKQRVKIKALQENVNRLEKRK
jgi:superfamily II DNA or RNA helicase